MDVVLCLLLMKAGPLREVVELLVDLFKVPRIFELDDVENDLRFGRYAPDVCLHAIGEACVLLVEDEMQLVDWQFFLLDESDGWPPGVPPRWPSAAVCIFLCAENGYDCRFHGVYYSRIFIHVLY